MLIHSQKSLVTNCNPIAELPALLHLDLFESSGLRDITPLSRLASLQTLKLRSCGRITIGSAALMGCGSLRDLDISCNSMPSEDLANLAAWTQLERLVMPDGTRYSRGQAIAL